MNAHQITITKTAKVITQGQPKIAKTAILALHGYGQLAQFFIRKFQTLDEDLFYIVAPEGMHRFYLNGTSGRVGASWMTKEERLADIENNLDFLDLVYQEFVAPHAFEKLIVLGFSQGAATAARWLDHTKQPVDAFIQWAGVFPPDLDLSVNKHAFSQLHHFYVVGKQDPYFKETAYVNTQKAWLETNGLRPEFVQFDGQHDIDSECLIDVMRKITGGIAS